MINLGTVFSGVGAIEHALKRLDLRHDIKFACDNGNIEINIDYTYHLNRIRKLNSITSKKSYAEGLYKSHSRKTNFVEISYLNNYKVNNNLFFKDVKLLDGLDFKNQIDLFVGGSPCQSFSTVGSMGGFEDARGTLFYDFARLVDEIQPKVFIFENVRGLYTHDTGNTWKVIKNVFNKLGYYYQSMILNAKDFNIPQNRRRVFVVGFKEEKYFKAFKEPLPRPLEFTMQEFLIDNVKFGEFLSKCGKLIIPDNKPGQINEKYFLTPKLKAYVMNTGTKGFYQKPEIDLKIARPILSTMGNRHRAGVDNYITTNSKIRMLSEREAFRLMGFDDTFKISVSRAQAYKQAGNTIVVDILMEIVKSINRTKVFERE